MTASPPRLSWPSTFFTRPTEWAEPVGLSGRLAFKAYFWRDCQCSLLHTALYARPLPPQLAVGEAVSSAAPPYPFR